ncbi:MAG: LiaF-related protein [Chloroflexota bacterium]
MQRSAVLWGGLLILFGGLLLLSRLGILVFNIWSVFWPLALVLFGLSILFGGRSKSKPVAEQPTPEHVVMELKGAETADVHFKFGTGSLAVNGATPPDELMSGSFSGGVQYDARDLGSDKVELTLQTPKESSWTRREWDVSLNPDIPLTLSFETGASENTLNLAGMQVSELTLQSGAGHTEVTMPSAVTYTSVTIEGGAGLIELHIPDGVAALIRGKTGVGSLDVDANRFPRVNNAYQSPDYETAPYKVEIQATVGAGRIVVQ